VIAQAARFLLSGSFFIPWPFQPCYELAASIFRVVKVVDKTRLALIEKRFFLSLAFPGKTAPYFLGSKM
jgi:hypothetical protein